MKSNLSRIGIIYSLLITLILTSCGGGSQGSSEMEGSISIDGSSTVYPISEAVAEEYLTVNPKARITVGESGTGGGFKKFARGESDINDASRTIKESEIKLCKENNIEYVELLIAFDGMVVVVHPSNTWAKEMTVEELKKLWEPAAQNTITRWNQIRPEWPNQEIHLYGPGTASGTFDYFTEAIVGEAKSSRGDYTASEDDNVLVQGVSGDKNALGFFGLSYYENNKAKLKLVAIDDQKDENGAGAVLPSLETVKNKTYSPLSRPLLIYVNNVAAERPLVQDFITFYLDNVSPLATEVGYIPLGDDELAAEKNKWAEFKKAHSTKK